jgi:hypothetical protein
MELESLPPPRGNVELSLAVSQLALPLALYHKAVIK